MENLPSNFPEILREDQEVVAGWKGQGFLEYLFLRQTKNCAVLVFKDKDEEQVKTLIGTPPFYQIKKSAEYYNLILQF